MSRWGRRLSLGETATTRALAGDTVLNHEHVLQRADTGEERLLRTSAVPLTAEDGRVEGAVVVFSDITEERRVAALAATAEEQLRAADRRALAEHERLLAGLADLTQRIGLARPASASASPACRSGSRCSMAACASAAAPARARASWRKCRLSEESDVGREKEDVSS